MRTSRYAWLTGLVMVFAPLPAMAQTGAKPAAPVAPPVAPIAPPVAPVAPPVAPAPTPVKTPAFDPQAVAATVNGQTIFEVAVQRGLKRVPTEKQAELRAEIIDFLADNILIDQYLIQLHVAPDDKDIEARVKEIRDEIQKRGSTFEKEMKDSMLTDVELRAQMTSLLRWDKHANSQATDKEVREFFDKNLEMFDGTMVRARHILLMTKKGDAKASEEAATRLATLRKQIEAQVTQDLAKLPANSDALAREKARTKLIEDAFSAVAGKESMCPSKIQGGDLGYFPRAESMVEPFAKTAYALKPFQMSDPVATQYGQHLILVVDRRPGKQIKFEEAKDEAKEIYCRRLHDNLVAQLRTKAKIVVAAPAK